MKLFKSYAHADALEAKRLFADVLVHLRASCQSNCEIWSDLQILPGQKWDAEIRAALRTCDLGLLFVSPAFRVSGYIKSVELPALLRKGCIAVGLKQIDFARQLGPDLAGLHIFQLPTPRREPIFYSQCRTAQDREDFAFALYRQIEDRLASLAVHP